MNCSLTRVVRFSSGHRYWDESLSSGENQALFGSWSSPYYHGHNYVLHVTCDGAIDPITGMIVNIKDIDEVLQREVVSRFDQRCINVEVDALRGIVPSTENLLRYFASILSTAIPGGARLVRLRLEETNLLFAEWSYQQNMITLTRIYEFAASHRLHCEQLSQAENEALFGKCNNLQGHGHNYILEVTVSGEQDARTGFIADLGELDEIVESKIVSRYDHKNLNLDVPELVGKIPTSEVVAMTIFETLKTELPYRLVRVNLHETARNSFMVSE